MTRLKSERLTRGLTLQVVGFKTRIQGADISKIERGLAVPYHSQRKRLARFFGLSESELLEEVGDVVGEPR